MEGRTDFEIAPPPLLPSAPSLVTWGVTSAKLALFVLGVLGAAVFAAFTYFVREPKGRGRIVLSALRTLALSLIVLLLLDPYFNITGPRGGAPRVVLDGSLSMLLGPPGGTAWEKAVTEAGRVAREGSVLLAGDGVRAARADSLDRILPYAGESRVLPALQSAAEGGAERVVLITDGGLQDVTEVVRWLPALGLSLDVRNVGVATGSNRAVSEVQAPAWAEAGKPLQLRIGVAATAAGSAGVLVRQAGSQLARGEVALLADGVAATTLEFIANGPPQGGLVRYDVALENADSIPDDDIRSVYVFISEKPTGVAVVSFDPDWEPRFLHPVLENALGLPVRTFLRLPAGQYFRGGGGLEAGGRADEATVQRAVAEADLLVLHGLTSNAPEWAHEAARRARRLIVFPGDGMRTPVETSTSTEGDWYVSPELPASPITSLLEGIDLGGLPPLTSLQTATVGDDAWAPLLGGRARRGGRTPLVIAEELAGRRWVIAVGRGYWRWAFRGGTSQDAYTRLWGALAGWVVQDQARVAGAPIRPLERSVPRATPVRWVAPGVTADSFVLELRNAEGGTTRLAMSPERGDTASSGVVPPGHYTYDIHAVEGGSEIARARGPLTVESYSPEFMRRAVDLDALRKAPTALAGTSQRAGKPLHTFGWLYVIVAALLCAEWILRRRWGLR